MASKPDPQYHVGQNVILLDGADLSRYIERPIPAVITRVGRTVVAIERYGREVQFDMKTGAEKRSSRAGGLGSEIRTYEEHEQIKQRKALIEELGALGVTERLGSGRLGEYSLDALVQVRDILAADKAAREG